MLRRKAWKVKIPRCEVPAGIPRDVAEALLKTKTIYRQPGSRPGSILRPQAEKPKARRAKPAPQPAMERHAVKIRVPRISREAPA